MAAVPSFFFLDHDCVMPTDHATHVVVAAYFVAGCNLVFHVSSFTASCCMCLFFQEVRPEVGLSFFFFYL